MKLSSTFLTTIFMLFVLFTLSFSAYSLSIDPNLSLQNQSSESGLNPKLAEEIKALSELEATSVSDLNSYYLQSSTENIEIMPQFWQEVPKSPSRPEFRRSAAERSSKRPKTEK